MRRGIIYLVTGVFVLALVAQTMFYSVRFTEAAVETTLGSADETDVQRTPGLKFKWPDPFQSVTKYDTRVRFLRQRIEQQQTADDRQLVIEAFCTWRVSNPLGFFKSFSSAGSRAADHYAKAESDVLSKNLRSALSEASKYRIADLFTADPEAGKLTELEGRMLESLRGTVGAATGIEVVAVGISRIELPEETTKAVFESMKADRARLVRELESKGDAEAQAITSAAEKDAERIKQFAEAYAKEIRARGDTEAAQYVAQMNENPELAVFLSQIEFVREALGKRMTMIFSTDMPGFELFSPSALHRAAPGRVPGVGGIMNLDNPAEALRRTAGPVEGEGAPGGGR